MQAGGGYMYNRYSRVADLSAACWYATLSANIYLKDFAIFLRGSTPQKAVSLELETVKTIWQYSISATWSKGPFRAEVGFNNPFLKHPYYDMNILCTLLAFPGKRPYVGIEVPCMDDGLGSGDDTHVRRWRIA